MCLRVFLATRRALEPTPPFEGRPPPLSLCALAPPLEDVPALGGAGQVIEVGSHTVCACGFAASLVAFTAWVSRRSELIGLEEALHADEREELDLSQASRDALGAIVLDALRDGPVRIYACWWGEEAEPVAGSATMTVAEMTDALEPFAERVLLTMTA